MRSQVSKAAVMLLTMSMTAFAGTVAHWNFEDGTAGQPFTPAGGAGSGYTADVVSGYQMHGWDDYWGPGWTDVTASGSGLAMRNADRHQDGYSYDAALVNWAPSQWTIEATFMLTGDVVSAQRWQTLIGRDGAGSATGGAFSALYFQKTWDNYFRLDYATAGGQRVEVTSIAAGLQVEADKWYSMAAISDGSTLSLYVNDIAAGAGWVLAGQTDLTGLTNSAMDASAGNWTFGRGWYNGSYVDHIDGYMDDIRLSDAALTTDQLITIPEPATLVLLGIGVAGMLRKRR
jgi:hypothetical protein